MSALEEHFRHGETDRNGLLTLFSTVQYNPITDAITIHFTNSASEMYSYNNRTVL